jgi:hypothetical protein
MRLKVRVMLFHGKRMKMPIHRSPAIEAKIKKVQSQCVRVMLSWGTSPHQSLVRLIGIEPYL